MTLRFSAWVVLLAILATGLTSCQEIGIDSSILDAEERLTTFVVYRNDTGDEGCGPPLDLAFLVTYDDVSVEVRVPPQRQAFGNLRVLDGELVNVRVLVDDRSDDLLAERAVAVRTTSRPSGLEDEDRQVAYCASDGLLFSNF